MTPTKRAMDLFIAVMIAPFILPLMGIVALAILIKDGRPVIYRHERAHSPDRNFTLLKFRTMRNASHDTGVSGGYKQHSRVTPVGRFLRRYQLDELPQLINVFHGDISFVGPRPPDPLYVRMYPELYAEVLKSRPGITGLATVVFHKAEYRLLEPCKSAAETEAVYTRRCIPAKAKLDIIYTANQSICFDIQILIRTIFRGKNLHYRKYH